MRLAGRPGPRRLLPARLPTHTRNRRRPPNPAPHSGTEAALVKLTKAVYNAAQNKITFRGLPLPITDPVGASIAHPKKAISECGLQLHVSEAVC